MRRRDEIRRAEQHTLFGRFGDENIETGGGDMPAVERRAQGGLVDQAASGGIDDDDASLGLGEGIRRQDVPGLIRQRRVQRNRVSA